jgi:hypothetical protein
MNLKEARKAISKIFMTKKIAQNGPLHPVNEEQKQSHNHIKTQSQKSISVPSVDKK